MLRGQILRSDGSSLVDDARVYARNAKRGSHDGQLWRGTFRIPAVWLRPEPGEDLLLVLSEDRQIKTTVIAVEGLQIHFRALGRVPLDATSRSRAS